MYAAVLMLDFMIIGWSLVWIINLKINYFKSYGICLDFDTSPYPFVFYPTYEYEIDEDGIIVKYVNRGRSMLHLGKGKKERILINKKDHNKVVGYRELVGYIILCIVLAAGIISQLYAVMFLY